MRNVFSIAAIILLSACATVAVAPENPWTTPTRAPELTQDTDFDQLYALMQPCVDYARESFQDAAHRAEQVPPQEARLSVTTRRPNADGGVPQFAVYVDSVDGTTIRGRIAGNGVYVDGRGYAPGEAYSLPAAEIVDWAIEYYDRPEEGNLLGRYLLLQQDGLVSGPCDPQHDEFQHFRLFRGTYSFVPPSGPKWGLRGKHIVGDLLPDMSMQEFGDTPYEVNTLSAARYRETPLYATEQALVAAIRRDEAEAFVSTHRYVAMESEVTAFTELEAKCALSHRLLEDRQALLSRSGERGPMIREIMEITCIHPSASDLAVQLTYSHRYQRGYRNEEFVDKATLVFQSLAFTKFES